MDIVFYLGVSALFGAMGVRAISHAIQRNLDWVREDYEERAGINEWRREMEDVQRLKREDPHNTDDIPTIRHDKGFSYIHIPPGSLYGHSGPNGEESSQVQKTEGDSN